MPVMEIGRICIKTAGREAGKPCVIVDVIDKNYVLVTGPKSLSGIKRRRCNVKHLAPTKYRLEIMKGLKDEEIEKKIRDMKLNEIYSLKEERRK